MAHPRHISDGRRSFCLKLAQGALASGIPFVSTRAADAALPRRQDIDAMDPAKLAKLEGAIGEMMERSRKNPADPKGWLVNAEPHNAFCAVPDAAGAAQIHFCYWFLPWHRAFLKVTEDKIRAIAGDSTLCLPYWNWSANRRIPPVFSRPGSPLAQAVRFTPPRALHDSEVDYLSEDPVTRALGVAALAASRFEAKADANPGQFRINLLNSFGGVARPNAVQAYGNGRLEGIPHGPVHGYVGGRHPTQPRGGDMANFATAARDPIFFAHHGNLDRLWEIWRTTGTNQAQEPTSTAFLKHSFVFPWIDGSAREITVAETLNTAEMDYAYDTLQVMGAGPANLGTEAAAPSLPPIGRARVQLPLTPESAAGTPPRYLLEIEGIRAPDRVLNAAVYVHKTGAPEPKVLVGALSVVQSGAEYQLVNVPVFDITAAVQALQTSELQVLVIPNALGGERARPYPPLRFNRMRVVRQ